MNRPREGAASTGLEAAAPGLDGAERPAAGGGGGGTTITVARVKMGSGASTMMTSYKCHDCPAHTAFFFNTPEDRERYRELGWVERPFWPGGPAYFCPDCAAKIFRDPASFIHRAIGGD